MLPGEQFLTKIKQYAKNKFTIQMWIFVSSEDMKMLKEKYQKERNLAVTTIIRLKYQQFFAQNDLNCRWAAIDFFRDNKSSQAFFAIRKSQPSNTELIKNTKIRQNHHFFHNSNKVHNIAFWSLKITSSQSSTYALSIMYFFIVLTHCSAFLLFSQNTIRLAQKMRSRQIDKQQRKPSLSARHKLALQYQPRTIKPKQRQQKKEFIKLPKKTFSKPTSRQNQKSFKNSLFNSVQQLPNRLKDGSQKNGRKQKIQQMPISSYTKIEDTTASRQAKIATKQYNRPNGEYFGGKPSMHSQNKSIKSTRVKMHSTCTKLSKSLEERIKEFRSIENMHESQSQSLKSEISDQEMRRLKKIHSLEKMKLMEGIIDIEEKIIKKKHRI